MKNILLIVNPVSGTLKGRGCLFDIIEAFSKKDVCATVRLTEYRAHATIIAEEAVKTGRYDAIVCCGGDGTLNEVIAGILKSGSDIPVGYIPAGSTNDFAAGLGLPLIPADAADCAADALVAGSAISLDIGKFAKDRYFTYIASFGAFTSSSYSAPQSMKNVLGHFAYVLQGVKDFFQIKPTHAVCVADGRRFEGDYVFCGVCNSLSVGGIVKLDEKTVNLSDGLFEIVLVHNPANAGEFNKIVNGLMKSDLSSDVFDFIKAREVYFEIPADTQWTLDGERAGAGDLVNISNLHSAVRLLK